MYVRSKSGISLIVLSKYQSYNIVSAATCAPVLLEPVQLEGPGCILSAAKRDQAETRLKPSQHRLWSAN